MLTILRLAIFLLFLVPNCWAGNTTICSSGCDYTTFFNWEAGEDGSINAPAVGQITEGFQDTTAITIDGFTGNSVTNYIKVHTSAAARHAGKAGTSGYRLITSTGGSHSIHVKEAYTRIEGLEIKQASTGSSDEGIRVETTHAKIRNCVIWTDGATADQDGIFTGLWAITSLEIENCIIYGWTRAGIHLQNYDQSYTQNVYVRNCTIYDCGASGETESGAINVRNGASSTINITVYNTIGVDTASTYSDFSYVGNDATWSGTNNLTSDATANHGGLSGGLESRTVTTNASPGTGDWVIFTNVTGGSEDFHLQNSAENDALDAGTSLSGNFTDDIDSDTRSDTWDIGADEYVAAGPSTFPQMIMVQ